MPKSKGTKKPRKNRASQLKSKAYTGAGGRKGKSGIAAPASRAKSKRKHGR